MKIQIVPVKKTEKVARENKSAREKIWKTLKKCTWKTKIAREIFYEIVPVKLKLVHVEKNRNPCPWNYKSAREKNEDYISSVFCKNMFFQGFSNSLFLL